MKKSLMDTRCITHLLLHIIKIVSRFIEKVLILEHNGSVGNSILLPLSLIRLVFRRICYNTTPQDANRLKIYPLPPRIFCLTLISNVVICWVLIRYVNGNMIWYSKMTITQRETLNGSTFVSLTLPKNKILRSISSICANLTPYSTMECFLASTRLKRRRKINEDG